MRRHPVDLISLLAGIAFSAAAVVLVLTAVTDLTLDPKLALPIGLVALGVLGLVSALVAQRSAAREAAEPLMPDGRTDAGA